eukprot:3940527-Rhodomonas_salina.1
MSGSHIACRASFLHACYAMPGTERAAMGVRAPYAMSGTEIAYGTRPVPALPVNISLTLKAFGMRSLSPYARAMRCPVLTQHMVLRTCDAMQGTDIAYGATLVQCGVLPQRMVLRTRYALSSTDHTAYAIGLRLCYAKSGTETSAWLKRRAEGGHQRWAVLCGTNPAISLRYVWSGCMYGAMLCGTEIVYGAMLCGTEIVYGVMISSTEIPHGAMLS